MLVTDDKDASDTSPPTALTVNNVAPTLSNVSVTSPINENEVATLTGEIVDPGHGPLARGSGRRIAL